MRIAFLTSEFGDFGRIRGGLGYHLSRTTPLLAVQGHECEVFLCSGYPGEGDEGAEFDHGGVLVRCLSGDAPTPFDDLAAPGKIRRHLRAAWIVAEAVEARWKEAPFDVMQVPNFGVSGLFVDVPAPVVMRFSSHAPTWHAAAGAPRSRWIVMSEILQRQAIARAELHFAPSAFVSALLREELALQVEVVRPPLSAQGGLLSSGRDNEWADSVVQDGRHILHAGQLGRAKGTDLVVDAGRVLLKAHSDLHIHFCGRDAGALTMIREFRSEFPGRVHHHGRIPRERLVPLMERADAVVCPSRADNLPNTAIEAMSVGAPVVGVHGASLNELVVDGVSGQLAPMEDPGGLASAVNTILSMSPDAHRAMGMRARERVETLLDDSVNIADLLKLYDRAAPPPVPARRTRKEIANHLLADLQAIDELSRNAVSDSRPWTGIVAGLRGQLFGRR